MLIFIGKKIECMGNFFDKEGDKLRIKMYYLKEHVYRLFSPLNTRLQRVFLILIRSISILMTNKYKKRIKIFSNKVFKHGCSDCIFTPHILAYATQEFLLKSGLKAALPLYKGLTSLTDAPEVHFLYELSKFYDDATQKITSELKDPNELQRLYINLPVWGDKYISIFLEYMAPSLLAKGNLPKIKHTFPIILQIFCDATSAKVIQRNDVYKELLKVVQVDFHIIPDKIFNLVNNFSIPHHKQTAKYMIYGTAQGISAFQAVQGKGLISFFNADIILGQNALSHGLQFINRGKMGVFINSFRSNFDSIKYDLKGYFRKKTVLEIPHEDLIYFQIKHIHPSAMRRLISIHTDYFNVTPQLLFYDGKNLVSRSMHYHPFIMSYKFFQEVRFDTGRPLDGDIPNLIDSFKERFEESFEVIEEAGIIGVIELSSVEVEPENKSLRKKNTHPQLLNIVSNYIKSKDLSSGERFFLSKKTCYKTPHKDLKNLLNTYFKDAINDRLFIKTALERVKK